MRTACIVFVVLFALFGILYLVHADKMHQAEIYWQEAKSRPVAHILIDPPSVAEARQTRNVFGFLAVTSGLIAVVTAILSVSRKRSSETE